MNKDLNSDIGSVIVVLERQKHIGVGAWAFPFWCSAGWEGVAQRLKWLV